MPRIPKYKQQARQRYSNPTGLRNNSIKSPLGKLGDGLQVLGANLDRMAKATKKAQDKTDEKEFGANHQKFLIDLLDQLESGQLNDGGKFRSEEDYKKLFQKKSDEWKKKALEAYDPDSHRMLNVIGTTNENASIKMYQQAERARAGAKLNSALAGQKITAMNSLASNPDGRVLTLTGYLETMGTSMREAGVDTGTIARKLNDDAKQMIVTTATGMATQGNYDKAVTLLSENFQSRFDPIKELPDLLTELAKIKRKADEDASSAKARSDKQEDRDKKKSVEDFEYNISTQIGNINLSSATAQRDIADILQKIYLPINKNKMTAASRKRMLSLKTERINQLSKHNTGILHQSIANGTTRTELSALFRKQAAKGMTVKDQAIWMKVIGSYSSIQNVEPKVIQAHIEVVKSAFKKKGSGLKYMYAAGDDEMLDRVQKEAVLKLLVVAGTGLARNLPEAQDMVLGWYVSGHKSRPTIEGVLPENQSDSQTMTAEMQRITHLFRNPKLRGSLVMPGGAPMTDTQFYNILESLQEGIKINTQVEYMKGLKLDEDRFADLDRIMKGKMHNPDEPATKPERVAIPLQRSINNKRREMKEEAKKPRASRKPLTPNEILDISNIKDVKERKRFGKALQKAIDDANNQKREGK